MGDADPWGVCQAREVIDFACDAEQDVNSVGEIVTRYRGRVA